MEPRDEVNETGNRFADGLLMPIFAVGAVFLFIILCFYAYNNVMKNKNNDEVIILDGDSGSFKVAPKDPGGMEVEHTDKEVFNTVTGMQENIDSSSVSVENEEAPVTQEQLAAKSEGSEVPAMPADPTHTNPDANGVAAVPAEAPSEVPAVAEDAAPSETATITDPFAAADAAPAETPVAVAPKVEEKKTQEPKPVEITSEEAPVDVKKEVSNVKTEVKKETDDKTGESKTVIQFKAQPKSMGGKAIAPTASSGAGSYYVQVSSHSTRAEANASWLKFAKNHSSDIGSKSNNITEATVSGKTYYRLSFGPFADRAEASTKCGILKAKGQDCIVQKY